MWNIIIARILERVYKQHWSPSYRLTVTKVVWFSLFNNAMPKEFWALLIQLWTDSCSSCCLPLPNWKSTKSNFATCTAFFTFLTEVGLICNIFPLTECDCQLHQKNPGSWKLFILVLLYNMLGLTEPAKGISAAGHSQLLLLSVCCRVLGKAGR